MPDHLTLQCLEGVGCIRHLILVNTRPIDESCSAFAAGPDFVGRFHLPSCEKAVQVVVAVAAGASDLQGLQVQLAYWFLRTGHLSFLRRRKCL